MAQSDTPPTPTTRILAIGTIPPGVDLAAVRAILPLEVRETATLYLDGKIDQWFSLQGRNEVQGGNFTEREIQTVLLTRRCD